MKKWSIECSGREEADQVAKQLRKEFPDEEQVRIWSVHDSVSGRDRVHVCELVAGEQETVPLP